jgi:hypothetical protein
MKLAMRLPEKGQRAVNDSDPRDQETTEVIDLASRTASLPASASSRCSGPPRCGASTPRAWAMSSRRPFRRRPRPAL